VESSTCGDSLGFQVSKMDHAVSLGKGVDGTAYTIPPQILAISIYDAQRRGPDPIRPQGPRRVYSGHGIPRSERPRVWLMMSINNDDTCSQGAKGGPDAFRTWQSL